MWANGNAIEPTSSADIVQRVGQALAARDQGRVGVPHALRVRRGAGRVVDPPDRVVAVGGGARAAAASGVALRQLVVRDDDLGPIARRRARRPSRGSRSRATSRARARTARRFRAGRTRPPGRGRWAMTGLCTAPSRLSAKLATIVSMRVGSCHTTGDPSVTPRAWKPAAAARTSSRNAPKVSDRPCSS